MPTLPTPRSRRSSQRTRVVVLGDLMLDVVLAPARPLESGSDVPGRVTLVAGGSAANTARWLARLGARSTLIAAVGRDAAGRALVATLEQDGVVSRVRRVAGTRTGRIGVLVVPGGERSFVADRGAADLLSPGDLRASWFAGAAVLHLPAYSLLGEPLGLAGRAAVRHARAAGAVVSVDLASIVPLLARGRRSARTVVGSVAPDILFATAGEAEALLGRSAVDGLLEIAPLAVVKRGAKGATVLARDVEDRRCDSRSPRHTSPRATRPEPGTRSMPGSWSAGSPRAPRAGRSGRRSSARPWPAIARRRVSSAHRGRS